MEITKSNLSGGELILKCKDNIYTICLHLKPLIVNGVEIVKESYDVVEELNMDFYKIDEVLLKFNNIYKQLIDESLNIGGGLNDNDIR